MQLAINLPNHMYVNKLKRMFSDEDEPISSGPPMKVFGDYDDPSPESADSLARADESCGNDPIIDCS